MKKYYYVDMVKYLRKVCLICISIFLGSASIAAIDYDKLYYKANSTPPKLMYNIDPFQDEDNIKYAWSPHPLFRTSSPLYHFNKAIPPGYYILTHRKLQGVDYVFFKENGKVSYIIPVAKKEAVSPIFYDKYIPKPKLTKWQKFRKGFWDKFWKNRKDSKRMPPPKSYIEVADVGNCFLVKLYFDTDCYWLLFKRNKY